MFNVSCKPVICIQIQAIRGLYTFLIFLFLCLKCRVLAALICSLTHHPGEHEDMQHVNMSHVRSGFKTWRWVGSVATTLSWLHSKDIDSHWPNSGGHVSFLEHISESKHVEKERRTCTSCHWTCFRWWIWKRFVRGIAPQCGDAETIPSNHWVEAECDCFRWTCRGLKLLPHSWWHVGLHGLHVTVGRTPVSMCRCDGAAESIWKCLEYVCCVLCGMLGQRCLKSMEGKDFDVGVNCKELCTEHIDELRISFLQLLSVSSPQPTVCWLKGCNPSLPFFYQACHAFP